MLLLIVVVLKIPLTVKNKLCSTKKQKLILLKIKYIMNILRNIGVKAFIRVEKCPFRRIKCMHRKDVHSKNTNVITARRK
ncbi:hypothetical protein DEX24_01770 [Kurthia sibirica]|uniref:Uncharacterized protein n=1 Tax=Kurthia sibirica TaxID=202750 RepID=A0A2U3APP2_9BACL|nr:hypothetical protein DEX24_01770 [Kurthia sibirica]